MSGTDSTTNAPVREVHRLSAEAYKQLVTKLEASPVVTSQTTDLQAGYLLGIQRVLHVLREQGIALPE